MKKLIDRIKAWLNPPPEPKTPEQVLMEHLAKEWGLL